MLAIADMAPCQRWVVTDVLEGPWQDPEGELQRTAMLLQHINVLVLQNRTELVNVFRLQHVVESHGPFDLVVSFGSWPNVLTDDLCQHIRPGRQLRKLIQGNQYCVFNYHADFLVAFTSAVMAQTKASFILIGPPHYTWQAVCKSERPCERFMLQDGEMNDYYQGTDRIHKHMCTYWPMSEEKLAQGCRSLVQLLAKHKRVLVLSAGKGFGWSRMMRQVEAEFARRGGSSLKSTMTRSHESVANYAEEHYDRVNADYRAVVDRCKWRCCSGATMCKGCLRKIKWFAFIEDKIRPVRWHHTGTQTQEMANQEESKSSEEVDEDEYWACHCV